MSTSEQLDEALNRLRAQGHTVQTNPGVYAGNDGIHITIDGQLRSVPEIYEMLSTPDDVFGFKVGGKVCEVHIYYVPGDIAYDVHQDGKAAGRPAAVAGQRRRSVIRSAHCQNHGGDNPAGKALSVAR
jgi:hypothetical protein